MKPSIITISRQFGSGGRQIGAELSDRLHIPLYDKALFEEAASRSGIHQDFFVNAEGSKERLLANTFNPNSFLFNMVLDDRVFLAQVQTIRELADQGPCIIVGRGANKILAGRNDILNVFVYASKENRRKRAVEMYGIPDEKAEQYISMTDKNRASYLKTYTDQIFGKAENYHLCVDSGVIGIRGCVEMIETLYRQIDDFRQEKSEG